MDITIAKKGAVTVLAPDGEIDFHVSPDLREQVMTQLNAGQRLLVDMSAVTYIDSSTIACLVEGLQEARERGLEFGLAGVQDAVLQVLRLTRLDGVFTIHASVEAGLGD